MKSVRETAPWLPDNLEFMRRINGLDSIDDVRKSVFQTSYMVFGLGDVRRAPHVGRCRARCTPYGELSVSYSAHRASSRRHG